MKRKPVNEKFWREMANGVTARVDDADTNRQHAAVAVAERIEQARTQMATLGRILAECERRMAHSSKPEWPMAETLAHVTETLGDLLEGWDDHGA